MGQYITNEGVFCKGCGAQLVRIDQGIGKATAVYDEMEIEFEDGSHHITPMCVACVDRDSLDLADIYRSDVDRWDEELKALNQPPTAQRLRRKVPVRASRHQAKEVREDKTQPKRRGSLRR